MNKQSGTSSSENQISYCSSTDSNANGRRSGFLHAVETAEKKIVQVAEGAEDAFVHAVRDEVELLFGGKGGPSASIGGERAIQASREVSQNDRMSRRSNNGWGLN